MRKFQSNSQHTQTHTEWDAEFFFQELLFIDWWLIWILNDDRYHMDCSIAIIDDWNLIKKIFITANKQIVMEANKKMSNSIKSIWSSWCLLNINVHH
mgnify:CR=1 FL=1